MPGFRTIEKQIEEEMKEAEKALKEKLNRAALGILEPPITYVNPSSTQNTLTVELMEAAMRKAQGMFNQPAPPEGLQGMPSGEVGGQLGLPLYWNKFLQPGTAMMMNPADALSIRKFVPPPIEDYKPEPPIGVPRSSWKEPFSFTEVIFGTLGRFLKKAFCRLRCELLCGHWDCPVHYP